MGTRRGPRVVPHLAMLKSNVAARPKTPQAKKSSIGMADQSFLWFVIDFKIGLISLILGVPAARRGRRDSQIRRN